ncbi:hypothetical protein DL96DRAFT_1595788 [Flagelloscypha sp. PMI_526]|nr:hypothetical protein DL96DRAFT_1595788 [Flagelloscypha sp. PMI_526]
MSANATRTISSTTVTSPIVTVYGVDQTPTDGLAASPLYTTSTLTWSYAGKLTGTQTTTALYGAAVGKTNSAGAIESARTYRYHYNPAASPSMNFGRYDYESYELVLPTPLTIAGPEYFVGKEGEGFLTRSTSSLSGLGPEVTVSNPELHCRPDFSNPINQICYINVQPTGNIQSSQLSQLQDLSRHTTAGIPLATYYVTFVQDVPTSTPSAVGASRHTSQSLSPAAVGAIFAGVVVILVGAVVVVCAAIPRKRRKEIISRFKPRGSKEKDQEAAILLAHQSDKL